MRKIIFHRKRNFADEGWQTYGDQLTNKYEELPVDTRPVEYWLQVTPNFEDGTFKGDVTIEIAVDTSTNTFELNCEQLIVEKITVTACDDRYARKQEATFKFASRDNNLFILAPKRLKANSRYKINVAFAGSLYRNNPFGFALYSHQYSDGNQKWENA